MQIYGPYRVSTAQAADTSSRPSASRTPAAGKPSTSPVDQLDISSAAGEVNRLTGASSTEGTSDIRVDRVADIRRQIASGSYDTPEKMDAALDKFLDQYA